MILSEIDMHEDSPEDLVHDVFTEALWPGHPLGRPILGTKDRIKAATRGSVRASTGATTCPADGGRRRPATCSTTSCSRCWASAWRSGKPLGPRGHSKMTLRATARAPKPSGEDALKRRKTVEQAHIVLGTNGLPRTDPDRFAFLIVNTALGGGMSSRLFQEIREKRGLAYTAYSYHSQYTEAGVFSGVRRHDAGAGRRGGRAAARRDRGRRATAASRRRSSSARRAT